MISVCCFISHTYSSFPPRFLNYGPTDPQTIFIFSIWLHLLLDDLPLSNSLNISPNHVGRNSSNNKGSDAESLSPIAKRQKLSSNGNADGSLAQAIQKLEFHYMRLNQSDSVPDYLIPVNVALKNLLVKYGKDSLRSLFKPEDVTRIVKWELDYEDNSFGK